MYKILLDVKDQKLSPESAQIQLLQLLKKENKVETEDYRDNVETQAEYFGKNNK